MTTIGRVTSSKAFIRRGWGKLDGACLSKNLAAIAYTRSLGGSSNRAFDLFSFSRGQILDRLLVEFQLADFDPTLLRASLLRFGNDHIEPPLKRVAGIIVVAYALGQLQY